MVFMKILLLLSMLFSQGAQASALIQKIESTKIIKVTARMVYSGKALTAAIAKATTDEIQKMWNQTTTKVRLGASVYTVKFNVDYLIATDRPLNNAESCAYNFVKILKKKTEEDVSYYADYGSNEAFFFTADNLGHSTTAAHEFGHGLMLKHTIFNRSIGMGFNLIEPRKANTPGIMAPRGAIVDAEFQRDPTALSGEEGGTLNPIYRKVRSADIQAIPFADVAFDADNFGCLGMGEVKRI
jgi:hypothetical protein